MTKRDRQSCNGLPLVLFSVLVLLLLLGSATSQAVEQITYYHLDALGSPVAATDEQGQLLWKEAYRPYGDRYRQEDGGTNDLWYTGKPRDAVTGLDYFGARWYDPTIGRFMGIDPVPIDPANIHSVNRYAYANNNPYRYVDPDGRNAVTALGGLIYETGQFLSGNGFNGSMVMGALADGYNGEGEGFVNAAIDDASSLVPAGVLAGSLIKVSSTLSKGAKGASKSPNIDPRNIANKTPDQIEKIAKNKGLLAKGPDPKHGRGAYVDPVTGKQRILCHTNCASPHGHVNNPQGQRLDINGNVVSAPESPAAHLPIKLP